jgi:hypothetical protein
MTTEPEMTEREFEEYPIRWRAVDAWLSRASQPTRDAALHINMVLKAVQDAIDDNADEETKRLIADGVGDDCGVYVGNSDYKTPMISLLPLLAKVPADEMALLEELITLR